MSGLLILFDGSCGICRAMAAFAGRRAQGAELEPLGGRRAMQVLEEQGLPRDYSQSVVVVPEDGRALVRSEAVIAVCERMSLPWRWLGRAMLLVPLPMRDWIYDRVARNRPCGGTSHRRDHRD